MCPDFSFSTHFVRAYQKAPEAIQRAFDKQLELLLHDLRHPSLRAKKYDESRWQGRVTRDWRFYFRIEAHVQGVRIRSTFFCSVGTSCHAWVKAKRITAHQGRLEESNHLWDCGLVSSHSPLHRHPVALC
jgi:hypothetical protein